MTFPLEVNDDVLLWVVPVNGTVRTAPRHYIVPMLPIGDKSEEKYPSKMHVSTGPQHRFLKGWTHPKKAMILQTSKNSENPNPWEGRGLAYYTYNFNFTPLMLA